MTLRVGSALGPYEILASLGAGGMGEVWKAKDSRLDRLVAIKVLPDHLAKHGDALARFEREAKAVAALNHPAITALFDLGREGEVVYAVMELLEGQSLREALKEGPLAPRRARELAIQMAQGLAAAHAKGVVHRDLKPDNLWITAEGRLKILDFGLAKHVAPLAAGGASLLPTEGMGAGPHTEHGMVLGTMGYMSPEQVRGEAVDARSDLFSFGVVLFEMLTGRKAFARDSAADTMAAILKEDPPEFGDTSRPIPPGLRRILDHCLEKVPSRRFHDAEDLAFALDNLSSAAEPGIMAPFAPEHRRITAQWALLGGGSCALLGAALAWVLFRATAPPPAEPVAVRPLTTSARDSNPAASPDGKTVAFTSTRDGRPRLWLKQLQGGGEVALTEGSDDFPRFSPDGSTLCFIRQEPGGATLYRVSTLGTDLRKVADGAVAADWSPDGARIAFVRPAPEAGGFRNEVRLIDPSGNGERLLATIPAATIVSLPRWNPSGTALLLVTATASAGGSLRFLYRVDAANGSVKTLASPLRSGSLSSALWLSDTKALFFQSESVTGNGVSTSPARAYRLDSENGRAVPLFWSPATPISVDRLPGGRLVFDGLSGRQNLREYPLDGHGTPRWLTRGSTSDRQPVLSPDGAWVAFSSNRSGNLDLWAQDRATGALRRLTDDAAEDWDPGYTPDGKLLLWSSNRSGVFEIWRANPDGSGAAQVTHDGHDAENPTASKDGRWIVYASANPKQPGLWKIHPDGSGATCLVAGPNGFLAEVSPDSRHVLFVENFTPLHVALRVVQIEDGKEVFRTEVRGVRNSVALLGRCRWLPDGRRFVFTGQNAQGLDGVFVQAFVPGQDTRATRRPLAGFDPDWVTESLGVSADGRRIVLSESERILGLYLAEGLADRKAGR